MFIHGLDKTHFGFRFKFRAKAHCTSAGLVSYRCWLKSRGMYRFTTAKVKEVSMILVKNIREFGRRVDTRRLINSVFRHMNSALLKDLLGHGVLLSSLP